MRNTWELVEVAPGLRVGVHTGRTNRLVQEAIESGVIGELAGYARLRREVRFGHEGSRVDFVLEAGGEPSCFVEVKNVTAAVEDGIALFPDAVSERGTRHLRELAAVRAQGHRAVLVFCVQRPDVRQVQPADTIDPAYGRTLRWALTQGVEVLAYGAAPTPAGIRLDRRLPVHCP